MTMTITDAKLMLLMRLATSAACSIYLSNYFRINKTVTGR